MKVRVLSLFLILVIITACQYSKVNRVPTANSIKFSTEIPTITSTVEIQTVEPIPTLTYTARSAWQWPRSTPEEQGLSSENLSKMLEKIRQENLNIHSILVIRHGVIVLEAYVHPFNAVTRTNVYSVTKSVSSLLTGIAIDQGVMDPVNTPVIEYFPDVSVDDEHKRDITVENLLTMTSGIEWMEPLHSGLSDLWGIMEADDPVQYFFSPALVEKPGSVFNYNTGGSHLLSIILQEQTGKTENDFAANQLFNLLEIEDYAWGKDSTGHTLGGTGLELLPSDMAKIGQLMLQNGQWQGEQVVSEDWVDASHQSLSHPYNWVDYGYQWWVRPGGDYFALGWGGQQIRVFPEQEMVVVTTAGVSGDEIFQNNLVDEFILPSIVSNEAIPEDLPGQSRLENAIEALGEPQKWTTNPQSSILNEVSGKEWLVTGMGDWSMFTLTFLNDTEARLDLTMDGDSMPLMVGLDGTYRMTYTTELGPVAMCGYWESPDSFVIVQQNLREADRRQTKLQFSDDTVKLFSQWYVEPYTEESEAVLFQH